MSPLRYNRVESINHQTKLREARVTRCHQRCQPCAPYLLSARHRVCIGSTVGIRVWGAVFAGLISRSYQHFASFPPIVASGSFLLHKENSKSYPSLSLLPRYLRGHEAASSRIVRGKMGVRRSVQSRLRPRAALATLLNYGLLLRRDSRRPGQAWTSI